MLNLTVEAAKWRRRTIVEYLLPVRANHFLFRPFKDLRWLYSLFVPIILNRRPIKNNIINLKSVVIIEQHRTFCTHSMLEYGLYKD